MSSPSDQSSKFPKLTIQLPNSTVATPIATYTTLQPLLSQLPTTTATASTNQTPTYTPNHSQQQLQQQLNSTLQTPNSNLFLNASDVNNLFSLQSQRYRPSIQTTTQGEKTPTPLATPLFSDVSNAITSILNNQSPNRTSLFQFRNPASFFFNKNLPSNLSARANDYQNEDDTALDAIRLLKDEGSTSSKQATTPSSLNRIQSMQLFPSQTNYLMSTSPSHKREREFDFSMQTPEKKMKLERDEYGVVKTEQYSDDSQSYEAKDETTDSDSSSSYVKNQSDDDSDYPSLVRKGKNKVSTNSTSTSSSFLLTPETKLRNSANLTPTASNLKVAKAIKAANAAAGVIKPPTIPRKARLTCNIDHCHYKSKSDYEKYDHLLKVHGRHVCPGCDLQLPSAEALKEHLPSHSQGRPNVCLFCGRGFDLKCNLTAHCRRHTGEKHFVCKTCGKAFTRGNNLQKHELTHGNLTLNQSIASTPRSSYSRSTRTSLSAAATKASESESPAALSNVVAAPPAVPLAAIVNKKKKQDL